MRRGSAFRFLSRRCLGSLFFLRLLPQRGHFQPCAGRSEPAIPELRHPSSRPTRLLRRRRPVPLLFPSAAGATPAPGHRPARRTAKQIPDRISLVAPLNGMRERRACSGSSDGHVESKILDGIFAVLGKAAALPAGGGSGLDHK